MRHAERTWARCSAKRPGPGPTGALVCWWPPRASLATKPYQGRPRGGVALRSRHHSPFLDEKHRRSRRRMPTSIRNNAVRRTPRQGKANGGIDLRLCMWMWRGQGQRCRVKDVCPVRLRAGFETLPCFSVSTMSCIQSQPLPWTVKQSRTISPRANQCRIRGSRAGGTASGWKGRG